MQSSLWKTAGIWIWTISNFQFYQHYTTVYFSTLQYIPAHYSIFQYTTVHYSIFQYTTILSSTLKCILVHYSIFQYTTVYSSTLQYTTIVVFQYTLPGTIWCGSSSTRTAGSAPPWWSQTEWGTSQRAWGHDHGVSPPSSYEGQKIDNSSIPKRPLDKGFYYGPLSMSILWVSDQNFLFCTCTVMQQHWAQYNVWACF